MMSEVKTPGASGRIIARNYGVKVTSGAKPQPKAVAKPKAKAEPAEAITVSDALQIGLTAAGHLVDAASDKAITLREVIDLATGICDGLGILDKPLVKW